jgi:uncharacterized membrane protein YraQ (UPF0718 family)
MNAFTQLLLQSLGQVVLSLQHNWPFLAVSVLIAEALRLHLDPKKVSAFLLRHRRAGVVGATAFAVATPFCSCGTTAVVLGMMASMMPWAPIVAFMVASPLTSPEGLVYSAGLFGWPFAVAYFTASIVLGLLGGLAAGILESRGWLKNQTRFTAPEAPDRQPVRADEAGVPEDRSNPDAVGASPLALGLQPALAACGCGGTSAMTVAATACCASVPLSSTVSCARGNSVPSPRTNRPVTLQRLVTGIATTGWRLLLMFVGFAFIGYFLNGLIPSAWVAKLFGAGNVLSVPLAATLGLPLYVNSEGSLPLVRALIDSGVSQGAAMAFLITGAGTSVGAVTGALTIARWRVIALVVGTLWVGAIATGYVYDLLLTTGAL